DALVRLHTPWPPGLIGGAYQRSEEHTSELQSLTNLVCRLLLEKKNSRSQRVTSLRLPGPQSILCLLATTRPSPRGGEHFNTPPSPPTTKSSSFGFFFFLMFGRPPRSTPFPYPTLFR